MDNDYNEPIGTSNNPKKKIRNKEVWQKNVRKRMNRSVSKDEPFIKCTHSQFSFCKALLLGNGTINDFQKKFLSRADYEEQNKYMCMHLVTVPAKRRRANKEEINRDFTVNYFVPTASNKNFRVCRDTFCSILGVSKNRVTNVGKYFFEHTEAKPDKRGGKRRDKSELKDKIVTHIKSFPCKSSHYARSGAVHRKYLAPYLSVRKMWQLFNAANPESTCKYSMYNTVFITKFNLGFGSPRKDVCKFCVDHNNKIKLCNNEDEKKVLSADLLLHDKKQKTFYSLMNKPLVGEDAVDTITIVFDLMQNQPLPKTPVGDAYYRRQVWFYTFGIVVHKYKDQSKENIHFYVWTEDCGGKGCNEILSCVMDFLNKYLPPGTKRVRLFSDGCSSQNKNYVLMFAFQYACFKFDIEIIHTYPIPGHSYLPVDRAFARVEKDMKKHETILSPTDYEKIIANHGTVHKLGADFEMCEWQMAIKPMLKTQQTFKISEAKLLHYEKNKVGIQTTYNGEPCYHSLLKRGQKARNFNAPNMRYRKNKISTEKKKDVLHLLSILGNGDHMQYYNKALSSVSENQHDSDDDASD